MARNDERDGIRGARVGHGARRRRGTDRPRDVAVRPGLAVRNLLQRLPHPALERGGLNVERQRDGRPPAAKVRDDRGDPRPQAGVVAVPLGGRVLGGERRLQARVVPAEAHGAHAPLGRADQQAPERRRDGRVGEARAAAAAAVRGGRHAEVFGRALVQPAARAEPGVVQGRRHRVLRAQPRPHQIEPARVGVLARRDAQKAPEHPLHVVGAAPEMRAEGVKTRLTVDVRLDVPAGGFDQPDLRPAGARVVGTAPAARPEPGALRRLRPQKEHDLRASRTPGRARRPAVDSRGAHAEHEPAVGAGVARLDGEPPRVFGRERPGPPRARRSSFTLVVHPHQHLRSPPTPC